VTEGKESLRWGVLSTGIFAKRKNTAKKCGRSFCKKGKKFHVSGKERTYEDRWAKNRKE